MFPTRLAAWSTPQRAPLTISTSKFPRGTAPGWPEQAAGFPKLSASPLVRKEIKRITRACDQLAEFPPPPPLFIPPLFIIVLRNYCLSVFIWNKTTTLILRLLCPAMFVLHGCEASTLVLSFPHSCWRILTDRVILPNKSIFSPVSRLALMWRA